MTHITLGSRWNVHTVWLMLWERVKGCCSLSHDISSTERKSPLLMWTALSPPSEHQHTPLPVHTSCLQMWRNHKHFKVPPLRPAEYPDAKCKRPARKILTPPKLKVNRLCVSVCVFQTQTSEKASSKHVMTHHSAAQQQESQRTLWSLSLPRSWRIIAMSDNHLCKREKTLYCDERSTDCVWRKKGLKASSVILVNIMM